MGDNMWATPEVFNNVHPQLGGLHRIMSSNGSVGNRNLATFGGVDTMLSGKTFR